MKNLMKNFNIVRKVNVDEKIIIPADLANKLMDNSKSRNQTLEAFRSFAVVSAWTILISFFVCAALLETLQFQTFEKSVLAAIWCLCVAVISTYLLMILNMFDFAECEDYEYEEIASLKNIHPEIKAFITAISDSGRLFISNYEYKSINSFLYTKSQKEKEQKVKSSRDAAKLKAFELNLPSDELLQQRWSKEAEALNQDALDKAHSTVRN